jgi:hypothetical protein
VAPELPIVFVIGHYASPSCSRFVRQLLLGGVHIILWVKLVQQPGIGANHRPHERGKTLNLVLVHVDPREPERPLQQLCPLPSDDAGDRARLPRIVLVAIRKLSHLSCAAEDALQKGHQPI